LRKTLIILIGAALFSPLFLQAQEPVPIHKMVMEQWTSESGLISNNLTSVGQSKDGFIWITSFNGALRFDGKNFTLFDKENVSQLSSNAFYSFRSEANNLFFSSQGSGVLKYNEGTFSKLELSEVSSVRMTFRDKKGDLWIATNNEGVYIKSDSGSRKLNHAALAKVIILDITQDQEGAIWIATGGNGLLRYKNEEFELFTEEQGLPDNYIAALYLDSKNRLWAGTLNGLAYFENGSFIQDPKTASIEINKIIEDDLGYLWIASERGLIRSHIEKNYFELFDERKGLPANQVSSICIDHESSIWLSTKKAGLINLKRGSITNISEFDGLSNPRVNIAFQDKENYYIGCDDGSVNIYSNGQMSQLSLLTKTNGVGVRDFALGNDGSLWIASYLGLIRYKDGREKLYTTEDGISSNSVRRVLKSSDGSLWLATRTGGVTQFIDENNINHFSTDNHLKSNYILSIEEDLKGNMVIGTHSGGITIIGKDSVKTYTIPGINSTLFFNITIDSDNKYWLSTNIGVFCFYDERFQKVSFDAKFKTETFFDLVFDDQGNAWSSTNIGILRTPIDGLNAFIDGELEKVSATIYDHTDGMISKECTGATRSLLTNDGNIWIPTIKGVAIIDINNLIHNEIIPNVEITSFQVDGQEFRNPLIEAGHLRYSLNFASLSYMAINKNQYKYKLEGFDKEWISTNDTEVEYTNLGPGNYSFQVIASNNNNVWNNEGTSLSFRVEPFFYQTIWFYLILILLAGGLIYLAFLWRISKVKEVNAKLVKVNEELDRFVYSASHDLRAPLSSILGLVEVAQLETTAEGKNECIQLIGQSIDKLDNFIKDIIDYSRNQRLDLVYEKIDVANEVEQIIAQLKYLDKNERIEIRISSETPNDIYADKRRLAVILKNLIANAFIYHAPHKDAPFIGISISSYEKSAKITIEDNGQGISKTHLPNIFKMFYRAQEDSRGSGLGLYIVQEAIDKIHGNIDVDSTLGKGTTFVITFPFENP